ncbi:hypothetical protein I4U23_028786 [Adineta vaga]|nr:hypothetical protein I4U23_028786 [Adineta vaga]
MMIYIAGPISPFRVAAFVLLLIFAFVTTMFNTHLRYRIGEVGKSILHSRGFNVTSELPALLCGFSYNDCLCSSTSNKSVDSENCITYYELLVQTLIVSFAEYYGLFLSLLLSSY